MALLMMVVTPVPENYRFLDNSHISESALELYSRASPSVGGIITAQLFVTQGEIPEEGRKNIIVRTHFKYVVRSIRYY